MGELTAVLVEDEETSAAETRTGLESAGFVVREFRDAASAMEAISQMDEVVDLIVLDRRLPVRLGEAKASDEVGDELLDWVLENVADAVVVVFSGHSTYEHAQFATSRRGVITLRRGADSFDRVTPFKKSQLPEFDRYVAELARFLLGLEDIQVIDERSVGIDAVSRRQLRRVAYELGGTSISVTPLLGGLTKSPVWLCSIENQSAPVARVVAKRQRKRPEAGGFHAMVPATICATNLDIVSGFCGGAIMCVQQLVGEDPVSLLELIVTSPEEARDGLGLLVAGLETVPLGSTLNISVSELVRPLEAWPEIAARGEEFAVDVPRGSQVATTVHTAQHGDLHPGNVLIVDGHPALIDFDSQTFGPALLDAVFLVFGPIFHKNSPLREQEWPTAEQCRAPLEDSFLEGCPAEVYFRAAISWLVSRKKSDRELFAVILAYALLQLGFDDVKDTAIVAERALALARWAADGLRAS